MSVTDLGPCATGDMWEWGQEYIEIINNRDDIVFWGVDGGIERHRVSYKWFRQQITEGKMRFVGSLG